MKLKIIFFLTSVLFGFKVSAQNSSGYNTLPLPDSLKKCIGQKELVIGQICGGEYFANENITLLYVGDKYPKQGLILVIKGDDRKKFTSAPEILYLNKLIKVDGLLELEKGRVQMVIKDPSEISVAVRTVSSY